MCGRFSLAYEDWGAMLQYFGVSNGGFSQPPRYNIAPGQNVAAVAANQKERRIGQLQWGLVPKFAAGEKGPKAIINARVETLLVKPTFRNLVSRRRCLIPADGFYEWQQAPGKKQPFRIVVKNRPFFAFAGLYDIRTLPDGTRESACAILTTAANEAMKPIHHRMPVILSKSAETLWLDATITDGRRLLTELSPYPANEMRVYPVLPIVGSFKNDVPACFEEAVSVEPIKGLFDVF